MLARIARTPYNQERFGRRIGLRGGTIWAPTQGRRPTGRRRGCRLSFPFGLGKNEVGWITLFRCSLNDRFTVPLWTSSMCRTLALSPLSESLEPIVLTSSASSLAAAAEVGSMDAKAFSKPRPVNLTAWAALATEVFNRAKTDLPLIGGGGFSAADKKATMRALEAGMHTANGPKVASGSLVLAGVNNFDDGAGTLMFSLTIKRKVYAIQLERTPSGPTTVTVGQGNPSILVDAPPITAVTGERVGDDLEKELQIGNLSMGAVNSTAVGTAIANQLISLGFPA